MMRVINVKRVCACVRERERSTVRELSLMYNIQCSVFSVHQPDMFP